MNLLNLGLELQTKIHSTRKTGHTTAGEKEGAPARSSLWESLVSGRKEKGTLALQAQGSQFCQNPMRLGADFAAHVPPDTSPAWRALISGL